MTPMICTVSLLKEFPYGSFLATMLCGGRGRSKSLHTGKKTGFAPRGSQVRTPISGSGSPDRARAG